MSFLGKLNSHAPPAPPRRIEDDQDYGWPDDEFDEDGDMYEAPPCERAAVMVPLQQEDNLYLDRPSGPDPSAEAPPPRPAKIKPTTKALKLKYDLEETYIDPNVKKPPLINRKEKPGKKPVPRKTSFTRPDHAPPSAPTSAPTSTPEDDVYLDPNEGQEGDADELYLEPNSACPPCPGMGMKMPLPFKSISCEAPPSRGIPREAPPLRAGLGEAPPPLGGPREAPPPRMKPSVPRALSRTHVLGDCKAAPPSEVKRPLFPIKPPLPAPAMKLHFPPSLKESKPSLPLPSQSDTAAGGLKKSPLSGTEESCLQEKEWFAGNCDRKTAEAVLSRVKKDGAFLVRYSSAQNTRQPYTLVVLYREKVYNIPIRYLEHTKGYALGKEGKKNEEFFSDLQEIISHHSRKPILLIDSMSQAKNTTYLSHPARP